MQVPAYLVLKCTHKVPATGKTCMHTPPLLQIPPYQKPKTRSSRPRHALALRKQSTRYLYKTRFFLLSCFTIHLALDDSASREAYRQRFDTCNRLYNSSPRSAWAESFAGELVQCCALPHLDLCSNWIGAVAAGRLEAPGFVKSLVFF